MIGEHMLDFEGMDGPKDTKKLKLNDDDAQYIKDLEKKYLLSL